MKAKNIYRQTKINHRSHTSIFLLITFAVVLLVPFGDRLVSSGDDENYFAEATSIAYFNFPHFSKEFLQDQYPDQKMPYTSIGSGILASPFVFVGSIFDRLQNSPTSHKRDANNIFWSWGMLGFQISSFFYLLLGALLLYRTLLCWASEQVSRSTTLVSIFGGGGLLLYVAARPVMSHAYEFFTDTLLLFLYFRIWQQKRTKKTISMLSIALAFVFLARYNSAVFVFVIFMLLFYEIIKLDILNKRQKLKYTSALFLPFLILIGFFRGLPILVNGVNQADLTARGILPNLFHPIPFSDWFNRIFYILLNPGMGMFYTATYVVFGFGFLKFGRSSAENTRLFNIAILVSLLVNAYIIINWDGFGGYYGYRYFVISASPFLSIGVAQFLEKIRSIYVRTSFYILLTSLPLLSQLYWYMSPEFQANVYTRKDGSQYIDVSHSYNLETVKDFLHSPMEILSLHLQRGIYGLFSGRNIPALSKHQFQYSVFREFFYIAVGLLFAFSYKIRFPKLQQIPKG